MIGAGLIMVGVVTALGAQPQSQQGSGLGSSAEKGLRREVRSAVRLVCRSRYAHLRQVKKAHRIAAIVDAEGKTIVTTQAKRFGHLELSATYFVMSDDVLSAEIAIVDTRSSPNLNDALSSDAIMRVAQDELVRQAEGKPKRALKRLLKICKVGLSGDPLDGFDLSIERG